MTSAVVPLPRSSEPPPRITVEPAPPDSARRHRVLALRVALAVSAAGVLFVLAPYWGWLVLAAWFAALARPGLERLATLAGGRRRGAAIMTIALSIALLVPISFVVVSLAVDAFELVRSLSGAQSGRAALEGLVSEAPGASEGEGETSSMLGSASLANLVREHSDRAFEMLAALAGSIVQALLGFMVLLSGAYSALVHGPTLFKWFEERTPASHATMKRLHAAFVETGRGLLIGSGLTGLVQAIIATGIYFALDVPRALVLGFLTLVSSVIPGVGTALIWVPVTAGLLLAGRTPQAILMAVLGTIFVSGIDSVIRPFFVRWGKLDLSPFIVMVSVFGGLAAVGPWGILLGPIVVRLALEVFRIARDEHVI